MVMTERVQEKMPCMLCGRLDVPERWDHTMAIHATNENLRVRDGSPRILRKWEVFEGEWLVSVKNEWIGGTTCYFIIWLLRLLLPHSTLYNCTRCSECPDCEHPSRITPVQVGLLKLQFDALFVVSIFVDFIFFVDMFLHLGLLVEAKKMHG